MARKPTGREKKQEGPGFEERLAALEAIVEDLEGEELPLEEAIGRYQQGVEHLKACRELLDDAERRLVELVETSEGEIARRELPEDPGSDGR